jgi:hypothetical protein
MRPTHQIGEMGEKVTVHGGTFIRKLSDEQMVEMQLFEKQGRLRLGCKKTALGF